MTKPSVIIIGAGMAGLTAAAYLSRAGLDVAVYEQHTLPGGYISSFVREGYTFPVGQMALTNYLTQSIVCTLIFYGYDLGLFGQMGMAAGIGLTIVIYLLQLPVNHWWMKRFKYGPAEWLWRSLTYLKPQPMKRQSAG
jgi:uncharacterized membrane protein YeiB